MSVKDAFSDCHPAVCFLYFATVISMTMVFMNPYCLAISLFCSVFYYAKLKGKKSVSLLVKFTLPVLVFTAVINPLFNHRGSVVLFRLPTGSFVTLESMLYGLAAGCMLASVLLWFACFSEIMTSDMLICLFGRLAPSLSMLLSVTLRFIPRFALQFEKVRNARRALGKNIPDKGIERVKGAVKCFSSVVTWSFENSIDTADSMKGRGYGLSPRTAYSVFTFTKRDKGIVIWLCMSVFTVLACAISGFFDWNWFSHIVGSEITPLTTTFQLIYFALCFTPVIVDFFDKRF